MLLAVLRTPLWGEAIKTEISNYKMNSEQSTQVLKIGSRQRKLFGGARYPLLGPWAAAVCMSVSRFAL